MKKIIKHFLFLTALVALFALLSVAAFADEPAPSIDMGLVFSSETQLTVYVDGEWSPALSDTYGFGDKATITAPEKSGSKTFSHWTADGSIISYSRELNLTMNAHTTLYAVYANAAPTAKPVAGFTSITRTNDGESISFQAIASGDEAGIVYSTTATGNKLTIDGEAVTNVAAVKYSNLPSLSSEYIPASILDKNNCWMLTITPDSADMVYHARAYVTVDGTTTYGDVKDVKLSELQSGIWMVANLEGFNSESSLDNALDGLTIYTVTFDPNGGVGATITQAFVSGQSVTLRANTFTRSGYTFVGWSTTPSGSATYTDGQSVTLTADTTLYAQWKSNGGGNPGGYIPSGGGNGGNTPSGDGNTPSTPSSPTSETHTSETATAADGAAVTTQLDTSTTTTKNSDGSVTVTDKVTETVKTENMDGTTVEVKTEKTNAETTDSKKNADGSVTDTTKVNNTETITQTATDANGSQTVTETKTEQEQNTAVTTKDNADGSKSEKTETTETVKVTEKVTDGSGKVTETVTTTKTKTVTDLTAAQDGTATGTSTTTTTVTDDKGKVLSTTVTEAEIKATTDAEGVVTTETTATVTKTDADGNVTTEQTVTTEAKAPDGSTGTIVKNESGKVLSQETTISQQEAEAARDEGRPAQSPLVVTPVPEAVEDSARAVQVNMPAVLYDKNGDGIVTVAEMPKVEIQVTYSGPGVVAKEKDASGNLTRITECYEGSVIVPITGTGEIVIVDNTKTFNDVAGSDWYSEYVTFVTAREIFNGKGNGNFAPNETMNRAMLAQVLYNFARGAKAGDGTVFSDVKAGDWFNAAIGWAYESGIVNGYGGSFGAQNNITRQDMATILYRYAKAAGYDVSKTASLDKFSDAGDVADYALDAMRWAVGMGLIEGSDGKLNPTGNATRAQVAAIMTRFVRNAK